MHHLARLAVLAVLAGGCVDATDDDAPRPDPTPDTSAVVSPALDPDLLPTLGVATGAFDERGASVDPKAARYQHTIDPAGCFTCLDLAIRAENYCDWHYGLAYTQQGTCYRSTCSSKWDRVSFNCVIWAVH